MGLYRLDYQVLVFSEIQSELMQGPFLNPKTGAQDHPPSLHAYHCVAVCCSLFQICVGKFSESANPWEFLGEWRYFWNSNAFLCQLCAQRQVFIISLFVFARNPGCWFSNGIYPPIVCGELWQNYDIIWMGIKIQFEQNSRHPACRGKKPWNPM